MNTRLTESEFLNRPIFTNVDKAETSKFVRGAKAEPGASTSGWSVFWIHQDSSCTTADSKLGPSTYHYRVDNLHESLQRIEARFDMVKRAISYQK